MKYRKLLFLTLITLVIAQNQLLAQSVSESRTIEESFAVNPDMSLDVTNKYGKIHLSPSNSDSVFIRIEMNASASKTSKLRKLVDGVSFDLTSTNYFVIAETKFNKGPVNLIEGVRSITNNLISSESKLEIDYYISVPSYVDISIDNRYGDIYIESIEADISVKIINGDLKAEDLWGNTSFDMSFCDASIASLRKSRINISYGELHLDRAEEVNMTSTSSKIDIKEIEKLISESKRDKYYITSVTLLEGNSYFSDYNIDLLKEKVNMTTKYGNLNIELIPQTFSIISVESSFTGLFLNADPEASFSFDAKLSNCFSTIPEEWVVEEKVLNEERNEYLYFGIIGNDPVGGQVILKLIRGKLIFDQNR